MPAGLRTYYAPDRKTWRKWLEKNHTASPGIWLIYYKKTSGKPRVEYDEAVEEALCFGWIDSTVKGLDEERFMQRFTPRKAKSGWSGPNKERIRRLIRDGLMAKAGLDAIKLAKKNGSWESLDKVYAPENELEIPGDLQKALAGNKKAKENFEAFPLFAKRQFLAWINSAKRTETRQTRIKQTVLMGRLNRKPNINGFKI